MQHNSAAEHPSSLETIEKAGAVHFEQKEPLVLKGKPEDTAGAKGPCCSEQDESGRVCVNIVVRKQLKQFSQGPSAGAYCFSRFCEFDGGIPEFSQ